MRRLLAISVLFLTLLIAPNVYAQRTNDLMDCPRSIARTEPETLVSDSQKQNRAKFYVNVGDTSDATRGWRMEFECGRRDNNVARIENKEEISREIDHNAYGCEFTPGTNTIKIFAITDNGDAPFCRAYYTVTDSATLCTLSIKDSNNPTASQDKITITQNSRLTASGNNLASNKSYGLFINEDIIKGVHLLDFIKSDFSDIQITTNRLSQGTHMLSLRSYRYDFPLPNSAVGLQAINYSSPLCILTFKVGTASNPGGVIGGSIIKPPSGPPVVSKGKQCGDNTNPGIATAIGCIHTNPTGLAKDLLKFGVGIGGGLAFLMMLLGAFQMLTSSGNPETLNAGRERLTSAVIGLLFVIFAVLILQIIGADILQIPGFKRN